MQALDKLTQVVDGETRFVSDPPLLVPIEELLSEDQSAVLTERMHDLLHSYRSTLQSDRRHLLNSSGSSASPARWSGSAASGPGPGSS